MKFSIKADPDNWPGVWLTAGGKEIGVYTLRAVRFYDARDGKELRKQLLPMQVYRGMPWVAPEANLVALRTQDGTGVIVCDAAAGKEVYSVAGAVPVQVTLSPDGKSLAYHDQTSKVRIHDLETKKEVFAFDHPAQKQIGPMRFSADRQTLYFGGQHGQLFRWDLKNNKTLARTSAGTRPGR